LGEAKRVSGGGGDLKEVEELGFPGKAEVFEERGESGLGFVD